MACLNTLEDMLTLPSISPIEGMRFLLWITKVCQFSCRYIVPLKPSLGHGKSEGMDQDVEKLDYLIEDTITFGEMTIEKFPGLPHFVLG